MRIEWDNDKNNVNIQKHGLDFEDAGKVFQLPILVKLDERHDYGEERWVGVGMLDGRIVAVVYAEPNDQTRRIISLRKATQYERTQYAEFLKDRLGPG